MGEGCMCIRLHQSKDSNAKLVAEVEKLKDSNSALQHNIGVYKERLDNQYSNYIKELERLNCTLEISKNLTQQADNEVDRLEKKNERLKEVLRECTPYPYDNYCNFCGNNTVQKHKDDCEYIKACGEVD